MGAALQQGCDSVLQGHSHLLGGLAQQWAVRVVFFEMQDMALLTLRSAATLLTHIQLGPALLIRILLLYTMDLLEVRLQRAALGEGLVTQTALVGPHTSVGSDMSLEVKGVIETLPTVRAEMPFDVIVTLHVSVQHALVGEGLLADVTGKKVSIWTVPQGHLHLGSEEALVSALGICQMVHILRGQLSYRAGP